MTDIGGELSVATTDTTKSPAAIGVSKVNDWFVWDDAGTKRLGHGPDWTNDTTRSAGTALARVKGIWLNNVAITNGPAAQRGTYVGTTRSNASSQLDWIYGAVSANGTAGFFGVWNAYNRELVATTVGDSTNSWTYATTAWRAANNSNTMRVSFVVGLDVSIASAIYTGEFSMASMTATASIGIGFDTTTAFIGVTGSGFNGSGSGLICGTVARAQRYPGLGFHFFQAIEFGRAGVTFAGDNGSPTSEQSGLEVQVFM
jgi:hypothetical protein